MKTQIHVTQKTVKIRETSPCTKIALWALGYQNKSNWIRVCTTNKQTLGKKIRNITKENFFTENRENVTWGRKYTSSCIRRRIYETIFHVRCHLENMVRRQKKSFFSFHHILLGLQEDFLRSNNTRTTCGLQNLRYSRKTFPFNLRTSLWQKKTERVRNIMTNLFLAEKKKEKKNRT